MKENINDNWTKLNLDAIKEELAKTDPKLAKRFGFVVKYCDADTFVNSCCAHSFKRIVEVLKKVPAEHIEKRLKDDYLGLEYTEDFLNKPKAELITHIINDLLFYDEISNTRCVFGEEIESIELYFEVYLENGENKSWSLPVDWDTPKLIHYFYQEIRAFVYSGEKTFASLRIIKEKLMEFAVFSGLFDNVFIMGVSPESTGFCLETLDKQRRYRIQLSHKTIEECRNLDYFIASYINKIKEAYNIK